MGGGCICKIQFLHEDPDCVIYNSVSTEMMILKEKWEKWVAQSVKHLLWKHKEDLSSDPEHTSKEPPGGDSIPE